MKDLFTEIFKLLRDIIKLGYKEYSVSILEIRRLRKERKNGE